MHGDIKWNKSLPAVAVSRPETHDVPVSKQMESGIIFCNSCKPFFFCIDHGHHHIKASPAWYALQVGGRETGRRLSGNRFFHSPIKHGVGWQISALLCFFERPGGFVEMIIPQFVQKEKRQTRKPAASMRFTRKRTQLKL